MRSATCCARKPRRAPAADLCLATTTTATTLPPATRTRPQTSRAETVAFLTTCTRVLAEGPYRMQPNALAVVVKKKVARSAVAGEEAAGEEDGAAAEPPPATVFKTLTEAWSAQLQMVPGVSAAVSERIVARYPTLRSLTRRYRDPALDEDDKLQLLADVGASAGKKLTKISQDIYRYFSSRSPFELVGAAGAPAKKIKKRPRAAAATAAAAAPAASVEVEEEEEEEQEGDDDGEECIDLV